MSYENFIPNVEIASILKEREKYLIMAQHCTRKYEGAISKAGDSVTIYVEGNPTVYVFEADGTYSANGTDANGTQMAGNVAGTGKNLVQGGIPNAEALAYGEIILKVNKIAVFNVEVGDIDQRLASKKNLMGSIRRSIARQLAIQEDEAIAKTILNYKDSEISSSVYDYSSTDIVKGTAGSGEINILDLVDEIVELFNTNDVPDDEQIVCEFSPKAWRYLKAAMRQIDTDNSEILRKRKCPVYNGVYFFKTNRMVRNVSGSKVHHMIFRTLDAVAFFDPFMHIEPYRAEKGFKDCLKGFQLFDCGIVKPKEVVWFKADLD